MKLNKITIFLFIFCMLFSSIMLIIPNTKANTTVIIASSVDNSQTTFTKLIDNFPNTNNSRDSAVGNQFKATSSGYLTEIDIPLYKVGIPSNSITVIIVGTNGVGEASNGTILTTSITTLTGSSLATSKTTYKFMFDGSYLIYQNSYYQWIATSIGTSNDLNYIAVSIDGSGIGGQVEYNNGYRAPGGSAIVTPYCVYATLSSNLPPSGTISVNFFVNNGSVITSNYSLNGNITWTVLQNGTPQLAYVVGNNGGGTFYFNEGLNLDFLPQLSNGWFFINYTLLTNTGYNLTYPINNYALNLTSSLGQIYNITLNISQTPNTINLQLIDVVHGSIYFQNYVNSVPVGIKYGSGIYNVSYGTVLYIGTLPDSGYSTDYYTVFANGVNSQVSGTALTIVCSSNMTITPHYYLTGNGIIDGGLGGFLGGFLGGLTYANIAVLIIYIIITAICTYLFAFTGLIAGLDISTVICFLTGLLGNLMYPVLGLVIIVNIALIITGSGLLNRRKSGVDA